MSRMTQLAVVVTCLLAAMTNAGTVTGFGLGVFVLPGVAIALVVGSFLAARRMPGAALIVGGLLVLGWSELVNIWSGTADGPVARATFVAAGCTLVAVVVARLTSPALFLVAVAGSVCGALLLGAGSEVRSVAVAAVVSAALTLGLIERSRRNWTAQPRRGAALVLLSLLVGAVAVGVVLLQVQQDPRQPEAIGSGLAYPGIKPPWTDPLGTVGHEQGAPPPPAREAAPQRSRSSRSNPKNASKHVAKSKPASHAKHTSPSRVWLYVLAGILLLVLAFAARLLAVRLAWRRLRQHLATGAPAEQITGAWAWIRVRLDACRLPLAVSVSPDAVAAGRMMDALPAEVFAPLQALARATTTAAFGNEQSLEVADAGAAWTAARQVEASARELLTRRGRVVLALRGPASGARTV